jgi:ABC-2 type transport system ATP-binding protein
MELTETLAERDQRIGTLSHGFRQRVGIAQAIVHKPELVVLDEPISGLDPVQIVEMRDLVRSLGGDRTVVVSSHILGEISETCDRILVIRDGEIVASGTEAELSAKLLRGMRVEITVRAGTRAEEVEKLLLDIEGVDQVDQVDGAERGKGIASFQLHAERDVREVVTQALVGAGFGLLELSRGERELESVFLELSGPGEGRRKKKKRRRSTDEPQPEAPPADKGAEP